MSVPLLKYHFKVCRILYVALQGVRCNGVWRHMEFLVHVTYMCLLLARYVPNVAKRSIIWHQCKYILTTDRTADQLTSHLDNFEWRYLRKGSLDLLHALFWSADRINLLLVEPNPRGGHTPSWKISNEYISEMGYLIYFHEIESSFAGIRERIMREESQSNVIVS